MAQISEPILRHLQKYPKERTIIDLIARRGFSCNWVSVVSREGTALSAYVLKPDALIQEAFGFRDQIAFFVPHYDNLEPRAMRAIEFALSSFDFGLAGRVDAGVFFLLIPQNAKKTDVIDYTAQQNPGWVSIGLTEADLRNAAGDGWSLRNLIAEQIYLTDLFEREGPLQSDRDFFGREAEVNELRSAILNGANKGVFGLRKTGKSSIIKKIKRVFRETDNVSVIELDCKKFIIRRKNAEELLRHIAGAIISATSKKKPPSSSGKDGYELIEIVLSNLDPGSRVCVIFDEVEYVSYLAPLNAHWQTEAIDFWQTIWAMHSEHPAFCFVLCGVNASILEATEINGVQNPLFGIVSKLYLRGLAANESRSMMRHYGKRMGLRFSEPAMEYLHLRYGGHPKLVRKACSQIHSELLAKGTARPVDISKDYAEQRSELIDAHISEYFDHILGELRKFYPSEYDLLCMAASGQIADLSSQVHENRAANHLVEYGIISTDETGRLLFRIECLRFYLARQTAKSEGRSIPIRLIEADKWPTWVYGRQLNLVKTIRELNARTEKRHGHKLFSGGTISKPEDFIRIPAVSQEGQLTDTLTLMNSLIIEDLEKCAREQGKKGYFWKDFRTAFPELQRALHRLRAYRNFLCHHELTPEVEDAVDAFWTNDFGGTKKRSLSRDEEKMMQQLILDELNWATQKELLRLDESLD